jgi:hypothetical protein
VQRLGRLLNGVALSYCAVFCTGLIYCVCGCLQASGLARVVMLKACGGQLEDWRRVSGRTKERRCGGGVTRASAMSKEDMQAEFIVVALLKSQCVGKYRQPCWCQGAVETGEIGRLEWTPAARSKMGRIWMASCYYLCSTA